MVPEYIDKYKVEAQLGKGSMGIVYKAVDPEIGRTVAIKTLKSFYLGEGEAGKEALERFKIESRSAGMLQHPNIITIFSAGKSEDSSPYIVMEYVEGQSLETILEVSSTVPPLEALRYLAQIAGALDYAHSLRIIHRDIKPSNVLVAKNYKPYLLDFGVAKMSDTSLTPVGTIVGTPSYMSPEQIKGEKLDSYSDLFSFAVLAFELFTGARPFPGKDFSSVVQNIVLNEPLSFSELQSSLPAKLERVLLKALSKDKDQRYPTAIDFVNSIAEVFSIMVDARGLVGGFDPSLEVRVESKSIFSKISPKAANTQPAKSKDKIDTQAMDDGVPLDPIWEKRELVDYLTPRYLIIGGAVLSLLCVIYLFAGSSSELNSIHPIESATKPIKQEPSRNAATSKESEASQVAIEDVQAVAPESVSSLKDSQLNELLLKSISDEKLLLSAIQEAKKREDSFYIKALVTLTENENYVIRVEALKALTSSKFSQHAHVFAAVTARINDDEFLVRGFAAKILGSIGTKEAKEVLEQRLAVEEKEVVKKVITSALSKYSGD